MSILLNDAEIEAMEGLRADLKCLYIFGIRRYMDYKTGIAGIKRGISYQSLSEEIFEEPHVGFKTRNKFSRAQTRRAVQALVKSGLIIVQSDERRLILKCNLAHYDNSVQNKAVTFESHQLGTQADIQNDIENYFNSDIYNLNKNKAVTKADTKPSQQVVTPPVSGTYINTDTPLPLDTLGAKTKKSRKKVAVPFPENFCVTDSHRAYAQEKNLPSPDLEFEKFKNKAFEKDWHCADWNAKFRNWLIKAKEFKEEKQSNEKNYRSNTRSKLRSDNFGEKQYHTTEIPKWGRK